MSFFKKLFFLLLTANAALLGYDFYLGGQLAHNLLDNVKQLDQAKLYSFYQHINTPEKLMDQVNQVFEQVNRVQSLGDLSKLFQSSVNTPSVTYDGNVVVLTDDNFKSVIDGSKPALVEFYAPWCGHCKKLAPVYAQLGDAFAQQDVIVAKFNADENRHTGAVYGVQGFPTLKWFPKGVNSPEGVEQYQGGRDLNSLASFIQEKSGLSPRIKSKRSDVTELTTANFHKVALNPKQNVLVEFYASWCGHCKNLAPIWETIATAFSGVENCVVAKIDADKERDIGSEFDISGYPTIKFFPAGESEPVAYEGGRNEAAFIEFLNKHCNAQRAVGGGLLPSAGRIAHLDEKAIEFIKNAGSRESIHKSVIDAVKEDTSRYAKYYAKVMEKVISHGEEFLQKEKARLAKVSGSEDVTSAKMDDFNMRKNILAVFDKDATPVEIIV